MTVLMFILNYWDVILSILLIVIGTIVKLKRLWRGNFVEWLIAICDEIEKEFGAGGGLLKHANAYAKFVEKYPIISKFVSQETFDKWVKEALSELDTIEDKKENVDIEEPIVEIPVMPEIEQVVNKEEDSETIVEIKEKAMNITLPKSEIQLLKLEKIDSSKVNKLKIASPQNATLELAVNFNKENLEKEECDIQISSKI